MSTMRITKDHTRHDKPFKKGEVVSVPFQIGKEMIEEQAAVYANLPTNMKPRATPTMAEQAENKTEPAATASGKS